MMRRAALAETAAHLEYLSGTGRIATAADGAVPVRYVRPVSAQR
jgi:hypothetical protein